MDTYKTEIKKIESEPGAWHTLEITVINETTGETVTTYKRNYTNIYMTFLPFEQNGKPYALISEKYTRTSVLDLMSGEIIATEKFDDPKKEAWGFCPVEFWHPNSDDPNDPDPEYDETWALVSGCIWGDDNGWKVQYLDLSEIDKGIVKRDERFGYVTLGAPMKGNIEWWPDSDRFNLPLQAWVDRSGGHPRYWGDIKVKN